MKKKKQKSFLWLLGFLGFLSAIYFKTRHPASLVWISFFGFFGFYFVNRLTSGMSDERLLENSRRALFKVFPLPLALLFAVGFGAGFSFVTREVIILACSLGYAATLILYSVLFWHYDTHC